MGTSSSTLDVGRALRSMLTETTIHDDAFALLLGTELSNSELERAVPLTVLRSMRHCYTRNFAQLLFKCIEVVAKVLTTDFKRDERNISAEAQKLQNALRLMRRMLPIAMESGNTPCDEESPDTADTVSLTQSPDVGSANGEAPTRRSRTQFTKTFVQSFFVENLACDDERPEHRLPTLPGQELPLGKFMGCVLIDCCFIRGLTLDKNAAPTDLSPSHPYVDQSLLWYPGVGGEQTTEVNSTMHTIRYEILYTLVALLAYPLFLPPGSRDTIFTEPLLSVDTVPLLPTLVASSLNTILSYNPFGSLPYTSHWVGAKELVTQMSARFLGAILCYPGAPLDEAPPTSVAGVPAGNETNALSSNAATGKNGEAVGRTATSSRVQVVHSARELIHKITAEEARCIVVRFQPIIGLKLYANRTYLPDSQRCFLTQDEFMMVLWRLIELSPECLAAFGREPAVLGYLLPLVDYALNARRDPHFFPHLELVLFIFMRLTGNRPFCLQCNAPFRESIPFEFDAFKGSYADLIIIMMCSFLLMRDDLIRPFHVTCSAIITNIAPFLKSVSLTVSKKLSIVFASVATKCLAYKSSLQTTLVPVDDDQVVADHIVMCSIVEAIASVLQYQEAGAAPLLTVFVERKSLVNELAAVFAAEGPGAIHTGLPSPFLIETLRAAIATVEGVVANAAATGKDPLSTIHSTTLVGALPTPHPIVVKRLHSTWQMEQWAMRTNWSSLYMHSPPGAFGESKSIKMLRFA
ncbi:putative protein HID1 isoform 1 [Trypanosoma grayi]|uniref:putative protein HID1 isoform 1 n=1 Tax=Trypanosoma grayi TaxID=71804 RepID=UPI0004F457F1|nr:putative protein HID1 isoform 1 [Trypanosoma grayi]KEG10052.1 putative protein HID1 isoform 1 [Trypanosoma grayi]